MDLLEVTLSGALSLRHGEREIGDRAFGGRQLRLVTAMLVLERERPLSTDRLAGELWPGGVPDQWKSALRGLVSQLRHLLEELGMDRSAVVGRPGSYQLQFNDVQVDVESTTTDLAAADEHLADGDAALAAAAAGRVRAITSRPFLPGVDTPWVDDVRAGLRDRHLAALRSLGVARGRLGSHDQARRVLREALRRDALREDLWRALMDVEVAAGNVARALACYEDCRELLARDLGVDPSRATQQLHGQLLELSTEQPPGNRGEPFDVGGRSGDVRPYVGLRPFGTDDADVFFGREADVDGVLSRLVGKGVVAIVGPSGSGKSSLVGAGVVPALTLGAIPDSDTWATVTVVPGAQPTDNLAAALADIGGAPSRERVDKSLAGAEGLHAVARALVEDRGPTAELLVVVDQLEELFTLGEPSEAARFADIVLAASRRLDSLTRVVLVLRSDFYDAAVRLPGLADVLSSSQYALPPMAAEQVEVAVTAPAARAGVTLEPGLLARIVTDVTDAPGSLPMLQHLLLELWDRRVAGVLTRGAYADLGGVAGALARRAEAVYLGLAPNRRVLARRVLLRGIRPSQDAVAVRRPIVIANLDDLADPTHDPDDVRTIVDTLVDGRLLVATGGSGRRDAIELAHEALIGAWPRLDRWVDEARGWMLQHRRLAAAAADWERHERHDDFLLTGLPLDEAQALAASVAHGEVELRLTGHEHDLLGASLLAREEERGAQRRRARVDEVRRLLALSSAAVHDDPPLALLTAVEAAERWDPADGLSVHEVDGALHEAVQAQRLLRDHADAGTFVALDPSGERFLAVPGQSVPGAGARLELREVGSGELVARFADHEHGPVSAVFLPGGDHVVTAAHGSCLRLWDVQTGHETGRIEAPDDAMRLRLGDVDPSGRLVAACHQAGPGHGGRTLVWALDTGELVADLPRVEQPGPGNSLGPGGATFSHDGSLLAIVAWADPTITQVVAVEDWRERYRIKEGNVHAAAAFSPDGRWLAVAGDLVAIVDAATGVVEQRLQSSVDAVGVDGVAWDARSERLFVGARAIEVWDPLEGRRLASMRAGGTGSGLHAVAISLDGARMVSGPPDGSGVRVWDVSSGAGAEVASVPCHAEATFGLDPTGGRLAVPANHGVVEVWDVESSTRIATRSVQLDQLHALAWSPDGTRIAAASASALRVWNPRADDKVFEVPMEHGWEATMGTQAAFSPDGSMVAVSDIAGGNEDERYIVRILDRDGFEVTLLTSPLEVWAGCLAFSRDGAMLAVARLGGVWPMWPRDFGVDIWDVGSGEMVTTLPIEAMAIAFLPGRDLLVAGGRTGTIELWNVVDGALVRTAEGPSRSGLGAVAVSPDGGLVVAGSHAGTLGVWDVASGDLLLSLPTGSPHPVLDVAFGPDGRHVFAGQLHAGVRGWTLDHSELVDIARTKRSRGFTSHERRRILGEP